MFPGKRSDALRTVPVWLVVCVWVMILAGWLLQASFGSAINRADEWKVVALDWAPWLVLAPVIIWLCARSPIDQKSWRWVLPAHLALSLVVSFSLGALALRSLSAFGPPELRGWGAPPPFRPLPPGERDRPEVPGSPDFADRDEPGGRFRGPPPPLPRGEQRFPLMFLLTRGRGSVFFYWALLAVAHAVMYHRRSVQREREALAAEARLAEARLTALQAQLQPHFLFNTLNAISSMVYDNPKAADAMLCSLSDLLRRVLAASPHREVALSEELSLARSYVSIQKARFGDSLQVQWEIPEDVGTAAVPTLLLQPLIENAVVHAVEENTNASRITVRAQKREESLVLTIDDTGSADTWTAPESAAGAEAGKGTGIGLSNTQARLQELYGAEHRFAFTRKASGGATVSIEIPYRRKGEPQ